MTLSMMGTAGAYIKGAINGAGFALASISVLIYHGASPIDL